MFPNYKESKNYFTKTTDAEIAKQFVAELKKRKISDKVMDALIPAYARIANAARSNKPQAFYKERNKFYHLYHFIKTEQISGDNKSQKTRMRSSTI